MSDKYKVFASVIGELVDEKQAAYGDSFNKSGEVLAILYPDGVPPHAFVDMLAINRVIDKLFRIATRKDAFGESPWKDIAGYALLAAHRDSLQTEVKEVRDSVVPVTDEFFVKKFNSRYSESLNLHHNYNKVRSITCKETGYQLAVFDPDCDKWRPTEFFKRQVHYPVSYVHVDENELFEMLDKYVNSWETDYVLRDNEEDEYDAEDE